VRRSYIEQLAFAVLVIALAVCRYPRPQGATAQDGGPADGADGQQVELRFTVWGMPWEDRLFEDHYCREFERLHPGVRIKYLRASDLVSKYNAWHIRGTGSDVMRQHSYYFEQMVRRGVNEPLDRWLHDPEVGLADDINDFLPGLFDRMEFEGQVYGIPEDQNQLGLFYNKDLFDAYNRTHPDDPITYPDGTWIWEDMRHAASLLTVRKGSRTEVYGADFQQSPGVFYAFLFQAGGRVWNEERTRTLVNSPEGVEVLEFWRSLTRRIDAARPSEMRDSAMGPDKFFEFGKTAMLIDGTWRIPDLINQAPDLRFGVAPLPGHRRKATVGGSCIWAMSAHSKHKDLAWEFIRFLSSRESNERYWDILWVAPPARRSVVYGDAFRSAAGLTADGGSVLIPPLKREEFDEKAAWMLENLRVDPAIGKNAVMMDPYGPYSEDLGTHLGVALSRYMLPHSTEGAQTVLDECVENVHQDIDRELRLRGEGAIGG